MNKSDYEWDSLDYSDESIFYDKELLYSRGEYLVEIIDKIPNKASKEDIKELSHYGKKVAVPWGCGSGKTTAMRQFIVENVIEFDRGNIIGTTGIIATKLVDDVNKLYFDILSHLSYINHDTSSVSKFINLNSTEIASLYNKSWIICTHERLYIEPPSVLYRFADLEVMSDIHESDIPIKNLYREYLLIDEYPNTLYKKISISDTLPIYCLDNDSGARNSDSILSKNILRSNYIEKAYSESIRTSEINNFRSAIVSKLPTPYLYNYVSDVEKSSESKILRNRKRLTYFTNYFANKLHEYDKIGIYPKNLYYSITDLEVSNTYIFDGTSEILFKDSDIYTIANNDKYIEPIIDNISIVKSKISRSDSSEYISEEYSHILNNIINSNPNKKILVYTWKSSKSGDSLDSELIEMIRSKLSDNSKVEFITYLSGNERVTSKYSDSSVLVILGRFLLPKNVTSEINEILHTNLSSLDFTKSLIIQFIYRSNIRKTSRISHIYFSDNYSELFIRDILKSMHYSEYETKSINHIDNYIPEYTYNPTDINLYNTILSELDDNSTISTNDLGILLGLSKIDTYTVKRKLNSNNIKYKLVKLSELTIDSKYTTSYFQIY